MAENEKFLRSILETFIYGTAKADKELSGYVAAFFRRSMEEAGKEFGRRYIDRLKDSSFADVIENFIKLMEAENILLPGSLKIMSKSDSEVVMELDGCIFGEICKRFADEDLKDPRGVPPCIRAMQLIGVVNTVRNEIIDWEFIEFNPPNCKFRLKKL